MSKKIFIFLIIGFLIYLLDIALNLSKAEKDIYIADDEIKSLIAVWKDQVGRNPNDDELVRIINNLIEEEILYREALKLGLDIDDKIIKIWKISRYVAFKINKVNSMRRIIWPLPGIY